MFYAAKFFTRLSTSFIKRETMSIRTSIGIGAVAGLLVGVVIPGSSHPPDSVESAVRLKLSALRSEAGFPGMTAAVYGEGRPAVTIADGVTQSEERLTPSSRMLAGSIGKTFVAAAALQRVESGGLSLDEKISKWLGKEPWFGRLPNAAQITLRHLMRHQS
jgi:D-alanyl-D-alanine carboxypeptidase